MAVTAALPSPDFLCFLVFRQLQLCEEADERFTALYACFTASYGASADEKRLLGSKRDTVLSSGFAPNESRTFTMEPKKPRR